MSALTDQFEKRPKLYTAVVSVLLVVIIGVVDCLTGYAIFFSAFYLLPVALASWFVGRKFGAAISALSVIVWLAGDFLAGAKYPSLFVPLWNGVISLVVYFVVVKTLSNLRELQDSLEQQVTQRTRELTNEMQERARLEKEILEISEREQRRIGHDLHDSICQHLTATAMAGHVLGEKLAAKSLPETVEAKKVVELIEAGIALARNLAHGISPADVETEGLVTALRELAANTTTAFKIDCVFECEPAVPIRDATKATHLYRIAQEAILNAMKHGKPQHIVLSLAQQKGNVELTIEDDGVGLPDDWRKNRGLGTRIMAHRASMMGGTVSIEPNPTGGTFVKCSVPASL